MINFVECPCNVIHDSVTIICALLIIIIIIIIITIINQKKMMLTATVRKPSSSVKWYILSSPPRARIVISNNWTSTSLVKLKFSIIQSRANLYSANTHINTYFTVTSRTMAGRQQHPLFLCLLSHNNLRPFSAFSLENFQGKKIKNLRSTIYRYIVLQKQSVILPMVNISASPNICTMSCMTMSNQMWGCCQLLIHFHQLIAWLALATFWYQCHTVVWLQ